MLNSFQKSILAGISITLLIVVCASPSMFAGDDDWIEQTGDVLQIALPVGAGATTLILQDWEGTWQFAKAFGASWLTTYTLKYSYGKMRPNGTARNSFPSGHTMGAFAGAAFIDNRYGHKFGLPAYALAVFTGYSRVHSDWHFLDDVVAGASISMLWSWFIVTPKNPKKQSARREPADGPRFSYIFDFGSAFLSKNEVTAPGSDGTTFDLNTFEKRDDPTTTASASLEAVLNERHDIMLLLNPFESRDNGKFSDPVTFQDVTFPADNNVESAWRLTDLRARWRYNFTPASRWDLRLGAGLAAEFVTVELASQVESDTLFAKVDDISYCL
jgi:membrane-associated phospholipid phosphatase